MFGWRNRTACASFDNGNYLASTCPIQGVVFCTVYFPSMCVLCGGRLCAVCAGLQGCPPQSGIELNTIHQIEFIVVNVFLCDLCLAFE